MIPATRKGYLRTKIGEIMLTARKISPYYPWKTIYFRKEGNLFFPKIYSFPWDLWRHLCCGSHDFPIFPRTLVPFSRVRNQIWPGWCIVNCKPPLVSTGSCTRWFPRKLWSHPQMTIGQFQSWRKKLVQGGYPCQYHWKLLESVFR